MAHFIVTLAFLGWSEKPATSPSVPAGVPSVGTEPSGCPPLALLLLLMAALCGLVLWRLGAEQQL